MSGEWEIRLMVVAMLFSPMILLAIFAVCSAVLQRMLDVELHGHHLHPRPAWSMHHRGR